jgi:hypothetical protein
MQTTSRPDNCRQTRVLVWIYAIPAHQCMCSLCNTCSAGCRNPHTHTGTAGVACRTATLPCKFQAPQPLRRSSWLSSFAIMDMVPGLASCPFPCECHQSSFSLLRLVIAVARRIRPAITPRRFLHGLRVHQFQPQLQIWPRMDAARHPLLLCPEVLPPVHKGPPPPADVRDLRPVLVRLEAIPISVMLCRSCIGI